MEGWTPPLQDTNEVIILAIPVTKKIKLDNMK